MTEEILKNAMEELEKLEIEATATYKKVVEAEQNPDIPFGGMDDLYNMHGEVMKKYDRAGEKVKVMKKIQELEHELSKLYSELEAL